MVMRVFSSADRCLTHWAIDVVPFSVIMCLGKWSTDMLVRLSKRWSIARVCLVQLAMRMVLHVLAEGHWISLMGLI